MPPCLVRYWPAPLPPRESLGAPFVLGDAFEGDGAKPALPGNMSARGRALGAEDCCYGINTRLSYLNVISPLYHILNNVIYTYRTITHVFILQNAVHSAAAVAVVTWVRDHRQLPLAKGRASCSCR